MSMLEMFKDKSVEHYKKNDVRLFKIPSSIYPDTYNFKLLRVDGKDKDLDPETFAELASCDNFKQVQDENKDVS